MVVVVVVVEVVVVVVVVVIVVANWRVGLQKALESSRSKVPL